MFEFPPRGLDENMLPTEWSAGYQEARYTSDIACSIFGETVFHGSGPNPVIEWTVPSTGGRRAIWVQYAALTSRPMRLFLNNVQLAKNALWETTGGWSEVEQTTTFQLVAEFTEGENVLRLEGIGATPHIRSVSVCFVDQARLGVDERAAKSQALASENNAHYGKLVSGDFVAANQFIATLRRKGLTRETILALFQGYVGANQTVQTDMKSLLGFGGPFNGERLRLRIVNDMFDAVPFSAFVETGAYTGTTTEHFAKTGMPVLSCEAVLDNFLLATGRLSRYENVKLVLSDSRQFLRDVLRDETAVLQCPLFYLDAHWFDDLPLPEELNLIMQGLDNYVAVIDDFEVPGSKYFFDRYANGNELTMAHVVPKLELSTNPVFMVPSNPSTEETGPRKGTLFVASQRLYSERLRHLTRLKRIDISSYH